MEKRHDPDQPVIRFNEFSTFAWLLARYHIARIMGAETLVCQGYVLDLEAARQLVLTVERMQPDWALTK